MLQWEEGNHLFFFIYFEMNIITIHVIVLLKVFYTKHFDDPTCEKFTEFHVDTHRTWWCCKQLKEHDKHFQLWNVKWAKFHFKDISTDGNIAFFPMNYCPYCGEKIEYEEFAK